MLQTRQHKEGKNDSHPRDSDDYNLTSHQQILLFLRMNYKIFQMKKLCMFIGFIFTVMYEGKRKLHMIKIFGTRLKTTAIQIGIKDCLKISKSIYK